MPFSFFLLSLYSLVFILLPVTVVLAILEYSSHTMPVASTYPSFEVPDVDAWDFMFQRKDRDFPDDKSEWENDVVGCAFWTGEG